MVSTTGVTMGGGGLDDQRDDRGNGLGDWGDGLNDGLGGRGDGLDRPA
jgi:hypothetical protein